MAAADVSKRDKWHDRYPELGTGPIPVEPYISREYFEKEREYIFRKVWLNIGRIEQIRRPGDPPTLTCAKPRSWLFGEKTARVGIAARSITCVLTEVISSCGKTRAAVRRLPASSTVGYMAWMVGYGTLPKRKISSVSTKRSWG